MRKILTAQIMEEIYYSLVYRELFREKQKWCHKDTRRTVDWLLCIDQHIFKKSKAMCKNLAMVWVDSKKTFDMTPQSWIVDCLKMYIISENA